MDYDFNYVNYMADIMYNNLPRFLLYFIAGLGCLTVFAIDGEIKERRFRRVLKKELSQEEMYREKAEIIEDMFKQSGDMKTAAFIRKHKENLPSLLQQI